MKAFPLNWWAKHSLPRPHEVVGGPQYLLFGKITEREAQMAGKLSPMDTGSMEPECQSWQTPPWGHLAPSPYFMNTILQCSWHVLIKQLLQPQTPHWAQLKYLSLTDGGKKNHSSKKANTDLLINYLQGALPYKKQCVKSESALDIVVIAKHNLYLSILQILLQMSSFP